MGKLRNWSVISSVILGLIFIAVIGQNCGQVHLAPPAGKPLPLVEEKHTKFSLPPPEPDNSEKRAVFFVDMSYSMVSEPCPGELDSANPAPRAVGCVTKTGGIDPNALRLTMLKDWIGSATTLANLKILIMPFSGGTMYKRPRVDDMPYMKFMTPAEASVYLDKLLAEHNEDKKISEGHGTTATTLFPPRGLGLPGPGDGTGEDPGDDPTPGPQTPPPRFMGTSVPTPNIAMADTFIRKDMDLLKEQGKLYNAKYHIIYLSDGVPKPQEKELRTSIATQLVGAGCNPANCTQQIEDILNGTPPVAGRECSLNCIASVLGKPIEPGDEVSSYADPNLLNRFLSAFGNFKENTVKKIALNVAFINGLPFLYGEGSVKSHYVMLNPEKIATADRAPVANWLATAAQDSRTPLETLKDGKPLSAYFVEEDTNTEYRLGLLYGFNPYVRVGNDRKVHTDSDGDGIFDEDEARIHADPHNARTNGYCLDGITARFGCSKIQCDPHVDADGDGLNECEEKTLKTSPFDADTDGDGIPDSLEVIYGLNPLKNDLNIDTSNDGVSNFIQFTQGVPSSVRLSSVPTANRIILKTINDNGSTDFDVELKTAPMKSVAAYSKSFEMFYSKNKIPVNQVPEWARFVDVSHSQDQAFIFFLARLDSKDNANHSYWMIYRFEITTSDTDLILDGGGFKQFFILDY